jgi:hypothetical protein
LSSKFILESCVVTINGVDFTDHCSSVEVNFKKNGVDTTNFSAGGGKEQMAGLGEDTFTVELQQDFSAAEVDQTLWPLFNGKTEFPVTVQPAAGSVSTTNPLYTGTCILLDYIPFTGKPGTLAAVKLAFPTQRTGITRTTS